MNGIVSFVKENADESWFRENDDFDKKSILTEVLSSHEARFQEVLGGWHLIVSFENMRT